MGNLLTLKFWLNTRPGLLLPVFQKTFVGLIIVLAIAGIVFSFIKKSKKYNIYNRLWGSLSAFGFVNAFLGGVIWFFIYETIPFLSSRFWFLIWGAEMVVWLVIAFRMLPKISEKKEKAKENAEYKKYIP